MFDAIKSNNIYKRFIDGNWVEEKETLKIFSPIDNSFIGEIVSMNSEQVTQAINCSKKSQKEWDMLPLISRCNILLKAADNIYSIKEELANMITKEISKDYNSSLSEVVRTVELIRETIQDAKRITGEVVNGDSSTIDTKNKMAIVKRVPLGVVLAISPFNYPINLSASKIIPALVMGNTVVFKPATQGAISSLMFIRALESAGLPKGVINTITGKGSVVNPYLMNSKDIDMINFTGSTDVGKKIAKDASMIPIVMELGGKDSAIVLEDADLEFTADNIIKGAFSYSGQRCTAIKRVLAVKSISSKLSYILKEKLKTLTVGNPFDNCMITPLINKSAADFVESLIVDAKNKGAIIFSTGERKDNLIYPTLIENVSLDMNVAHEEPFGPILPIITIESIEEAIDINNSSPFGLQSSIFSNNINDIFYIAERLEVGTVNVNGKSERGPDNFPFLGIKNSGIGVQGIKYSLEACTTIKSIVINKAK